MNAVQALKTIAALGGNLSDERLTDRTGPNDAAHRGLMYTEARRIARESLQSRQAEELEALRQQQAAERATLPPIVDKRYSLDLTRIGCGAEGDARAKRLKSLLNGQTYNGAVRAGE